MRKLVAVVAALVIAGCGGSGARPKHTSCISTNGYGGLGARVSAFDANNDGSTGPAEPTPGAAWYQVTGTENGCIAAYSVQDSATPPLGPRQMLILVGHPYLPADAHQLVTTSTCAVWKSAALERAVGLMYARATAVAQDWTVPGSAQIEAASDPTC